MGLVGQCTTILGVDVPKIQLVLSKTKKDMLSQGFGVQNPFHRIKILKMFDVQTPISSMKISMNESFFSMMFP